MKPILVVILAAAVFLIPVHYNAFTKQFLDSEKLVKPMPVRQKVFILKAAKKMSGLLTEDNENFLHQDLFFFKW